MNRVLTAYADVDSLFDYRRGLIQKWLTRDMAVSDENSLSDEAFAAYQEKRRLQGDTLWELHIEKNYRERRMDTFSYPFFGFTRQIFRELYQKRSLRDWGYGYYPTGFLSNFVKVIIEHEQLTDKPIEIKGVTLTINCFPYVMDTALKEELIEHVKTRLGYRVEVKTVDDDIINATPSYYRQFDYVFKYDFLLNEDYKSFFENVGKPPIPDTAFLVPDLLVQETEYLEGSIYDRIFAQSIALAPVLKLIPINKGFYDYLTD
ncbi:MAG: hypothetical protein DI535_28770 [Citrobacter freundii]|nr:MAG: hypothetical protein DI535_28770 [Citrobacter freundii]